MNNIINKELEDIKHMYNCCYESSKKYKKYSDISNIILILNQPLFTIAFYNKFCYKRFLPLCTIIPAIHSYLNYQKEDNNYFNSGQEYYKLYNKYKNKTFDNPDEIYNEIIKVKLIISQNHSTIDNDIYNLINNKS
jgi:hypothetical protein